MAEEIQNKKHRNWYRGAIATLITKKAVAPFSEDVISDFVEKQIVDINKINNRESGLVCRSCKIQNLLPCPTRGFCSVSKGQCKFHLTPDLLPRPCPNGICDKIRNEIILHHRFSSPSWKNTKAEEWCINSWQVAKCFLPPGGYIDICYPDDTDFNGIISLISNCTLFQKYFNDDLSDKGNVCEQAREVGRSIRHSPSLHVCDSELSGYFDALVALLSDATLQQSHKATKQALRKLRKLKASPYATCIEEEIAEESLKSSSSNESLPKCLSDCLKHTISKGDDFWDTSDGSSNVDDGIETDRDSVGNYSSSISSENIQEDSHGEKSTADQHNDNLELEVIIRQTSESELEQLRATEEDESDLDLEYTEKALMKREKKMRGSESGIYTMPSNNTSTATIRYTSHRPWQPVKESFSLSVLPDYSRHKRGQHGADSWVKASIYGLLSVLLAFIFWIMIGNVTVLLGLCISAKDYILFPGQPLMFVILMCLCTVFSRFHLALPLMIMFISAEDCPGLPAVRLVLFAYTITSGFVAFTPFRRLSGCSFYALELTEGTVTFYISQSISYLISVFITFTGIGLKTFEVFRVRDWPFVLLIPDQMGDYEVFHIPWILKVVECQNDVNSTSLNATYELSKTIESNITKTCVRFGDNDIQPIKTVIFTAFLLIALCGLYELLRLLLSKQPFEHILEIVITRVYKTYEGTHLGSFKTKFWAIVYGMLMGVLTLTHAASDDWCYSYDDFETDNLTEYVLLGSFLICSQLASLFLLLFTNSKLLPICLISAMIGLLLFVLTLVCMLLNENGRMCILRPLQRLLYFLIRHSTRNVIYIHVILHCIILPCVVLCLFVLYNFDQKLCLTIVLLSHFISLVFLAALNHCVKRIGWKN